MVAHPEPPSPDELLQLVANHSLLSAIEAASLEQLKQELSWVSLDAGEVLFHEGDPVDSLYFVVEGKIEVSTIQEDLDGNPDNDRLTLAELGPESTIGEMAILTGGVRNATVTALERCGLVKFPKEAFDKFLASDPHVVNELTKTIMPRLYRNQIVDVLPKLFGELDKEMLQDLEDKMTWMHLPRGEQLCRQGDPSDSFYIIISGRVQVLIRDEDGQQRQVGEIAQGESVGEMGVFTGDTRSATIVASRDSELLEFSKQEFDEFTSKYPLLMQHLMRLLIKRLQGAFRQDRASKLSTNILLAPASDGAPVDEFAAKLSEALSEVDAGDKDAGGRSRSCLLLTSRIVGDMLGHEGVAQSEKGDPDDLRLRSWLSEQEKTYRAILFQADLELNAWTRRCIRCTDEIMYVAAAADKPSASAIVPEVHRQEQRSQTRRRRSLVLLHDPHVTRPRGTIDWLRALSLVGESVDHQINARHFHVRRGSDDDCRRVARFLTGREIGLVFSGGGARGFAHVGCIRAMQELNIPIDMIGGVSMGSLVSAAYAYDVAAFEQTIHRIKGKLKGALFDFTAPVVSCARGRRFDRRLKSWFQDVRIEDLWLPYFCVSSDLTKARLFIWEFGSLWRAVRASGTLPGLTSPVIQDKCLLFDGCLLDNLPTDVMRNRIGAAQVIAVDVIPPEDKDLEVKMKGVKIERVKLQSPSGWSLLWNKLNPWGNKVEVPNIVSIVHRASEIGSVYGRKKLINDRLEDIYLAPDVSDIKIADFTMVEEAAEIGETYCKQKLAEWWTSQ